MNGSGAFGWGGEGGRSSSFSDAFPSFSSAEASPMHVYKIRISHEKVVKGFACGDFAFLAQFTFKCCPALENSLLSYWQGGGSHILHVSVTVRIKKIGKNGFVMNHNRQRRSYEKGRFTNNLIHLKLFN